VHDADRIPVGDSGDLSGRAWQLIDGESVVMAPGSKTHAAIQGHIRAADGVLSLACVAFSDRWAALYRTTSLAPQT
jgi:hypothetical protein